MTNDHDAEWSGPVPGLSITIGNDMREVERLAATVRAFLAMRGLTPEAEYAIDLSLKEIIASIIARDSDDTRCHAIDVRVRLMLPDIYVQIEDDGHEFNPLAVIKAERDVPMETMEESPVANLGLHFVRTMAKSADYFRSDAHNVLRLVIDAGANC